MLKSLQAGRGVAAVLVVLYHLGLAVDKYFGGGAIMLPAGRSGVEFFFVLSGFIIACAHWDDVGRPERLGRFVWKRFVRIYPIFWIVFLAALAGAHLILERQLPLADVAQAMLLAPGSEAPVISVAWSLQWELVFYVIFAGLIVHPVIAFMLSAMVLAWLPDSPTYLFLLFAGVACAYIDRRQFALPARTLVLFGAVVFAGSGAFETARGIQPHLFYGLGAAMLVTGLVRSERNGTVLGNRPWVQLIGNASYSIYLVHYPFISAACKLAFAVGLRGSTGGVITYAMALPASVAAGVLLHLFVERPLLAFLNRMKLPQFAARSS
jgi:exopolysaccharide production protein ExoZ